MSQLWIQEIQHYFHWFFYACSSPQPAVRHRTEKMDYWEAKVWIDLSPRPEEHLWYSIQDSTEYKKREEALIKELEQPNFNSHASDYMKSQAYQDFKQYINNHPEYIALLCQGFLFKNIKGLHGYLIDDIIQSRYPSAPSIRTYVDKTTNVDDEKFAVYQWQRKVWFLMNEEKETFLDQIDKVWK